MFATQVLSLICLLAIVLDIISYWRVIETNKQKIELLKTLIDKDYETEQIDINAFLK